MWPFLWRGVSVPPPLADPPIWMVEEVRQRTGKPAEECRRILSSPTLEEYWTLTGDGPNDFDECDPAESSAVLAPYLLRATLEAEREMGPDCGDGDLLSFWDCKKRILRRRYRIKWRDPFDMNPGNCYD